MTTAVGRPSSDREYPAARITAFSATVEGVGIALFTAWVVVELLGEFEVEAVAAAFGTTILGVGVVALAHWLLGRALRSGVAPRARWRVLLYAVIALQPLIVPGAGIAAVDREEMLGLRVISAVIVVSAVVLVIAAIALLVAMALQDRRSPTSA